MSREEKEPKESEKIAVMATRDGILLKLLISGPCTFLYLLKTCLYFESDSALRQRLAQLIRSGHIKSRSYRDEKTGHKFSLYVLGPAGVRFVVRNKDCTVDEIRNMLPSVHTVAHELVLTDIVRKLRWESDRIGHRLCYYDDPKCRGHRHLLNITGPVSDLMVDITLVDITVPYRLLVEVDMGSVALLEMVDRTLKQEHMVIFICTEQGRIDQLQDAMRGHDKLSDMVFFATAYEFCRQPGGVFGTNFLDLGGSLVSFYPTKRD